MDWGDIVLGYRLGCTTMLLVWVLWDVFVDTSARPTQNLQEFKDVVPVYRGIACLIGLVWFWFLNLSVFKQYNINYAFLLDIDNRLSLDRRAVLREASTLSVVFLANFLFYFKALRRDGFSFVPPNYFPAALCVYIAFKLVYPWEQRFPFWKTSYEVITAPFAPLTFRHGYVADVFTSIVKVLADIAYVFCFLGTGQWWNGDVRPCSATPYYQNFVIPLTSSLPLWWRFMQTIKQYRDTRSRWPYLGNAFKYAFAQSVIMFGVFKPHLRSPLTDTSEVPAYQAVWIMTFVCSTLYSFWWDVVMDWGLGVAEFGYLRERLLFKRRSIYYLAIVVDLFLRFLWTFSLIPVQALPVYLAKYTDVWMIAVLAFAEIFRRSMWGCFRLEWEEIVTSGGLSQADIKPAFQERSPPLEGKRVVLEAALFVISVISICVIAAVS